MKKQLLFLSLSLLSINVYATCPALTGKYANCKSEINPKMRGAYIIEQHQENNYEVYDVKFIDDETGEERHDKMATNGVKISRKERVPKIGINVRVEASSTCEGNAVVTTSDAFWMGGRVGQFVTKIYRTGNSLHSDIDGSYIGRDIVKRITCELE